MRSDEVFKTLNFDKTKNERYFLRFYKNLHALGVPALIWEVSQEK